jgi:type 1 glutamine amidotransferase
LKHAGLGAVALGAANLPFVAAAAPDEPSKKRLLMFTRSEGYEHDVVKRVDGKPALAERTVTELGGKHNIEVVCEKDGRVFLSKDFPTFDGFLFETQGDLAAENSKDGAPPMTADGKKALLDAIAGGKGFVGCHCASDTFHTAGEKWETQPRDKQDPYIAMLGGEFIRHGEQQEGGMIVADPKFFGSDKVGDFKIKEEWYTLKNFAPDLHVILVQDTKGMKNVDYERPPYPASWARLHDKGRVFFTSMGHRDDVWKDATFQLLLTTALNWTLGRVELDLKPNIDKVTPKANELPKVK